MKQGILISGVLMNIKQDSKTFDGVTTSYQTLQIMTNNESEGLQLIDVKDSDFKIDKSMLNKEVQYQISVSSYNGKLYFRLS